MTTVKIQSAPGRPGSFLVGVQQGNSQEKAVVAMGTLYSEAEAVAVGSAIAAEFAPRSQLFLETLLETRDMSPYVQAAREWAQKHLTRYR